jgi:hypothetical protein
MPQGHTGNSGSLSQCNACSQRHCSSAECLDDTDCRRRGTLRGLGRVMCALSAAMVVACIYTLAN